MTRLLPLTLSLWMLLSLDGCVSSPAERAALDEQVGKASTEGAQLVVEHGHAAVRGLSPGSMTLWSSTPTWRATLEVEEAATWTITIDNTLPDATLRAITTPGEPAVTELDGERVTQRVFAVDLPAGTTTLQLETADQLDPSVFRIALMSDIQDAVDEVQDLFDAIEAEPDVRFLLGAGDLAQNGSRDELLRIQRELQRFDLPYYTTLGNHDIRDTGAWQELYGRGNTSFAFRGVRFTLLDSAAASIEPKVYEWLDGWLADGAGATHVVGMHIPPLDPVGVRNGGFGSRHEAGKLVTKLAGGGVDLTVYGHIHSYYRFDNAGIPAVISGGGGAIPERFAGIGRHFAVIDIGADAGFVGVRTVEVD